VASIWFVFFSYHNDARSNKHQMLLCLRMALFETDVRVSW